MRLEAVATLQMPASGRSVSTGVYTPTTWYLRAPKMIRRTLTDPPPCHCRREEVYTKTFSWQTDCRAVSTRRGATLFSSPVYEPVAPPHLKAYANQLDKPVDPKCPSCGEEPQTVKHWLQRCPNGVALRQ